MTWRWPWKAGSSPLPGQMPGPPVLRARATAPIAMPRRLALGDAPWWVGALPAVVVAATAVLLVAVATRIYERSLMRSSGRLGWGTALGLGREHAATVPVPEGA